MKKQTCAQHYFKLFLKNQPLQTIGPFRNLEQARNWAENRRGKHPHKPIRYSKIIELA